MSNRSTKRSILTERKVRSVIREEINTRYGNNLTARQKAMLEEGILDAMKGLFGGVKNAVGVAGTQAAGLAKKATNAVGTAAIRATNNVASAVGNVVGDMAASLKAAAEPIKKELGDSAKSIATAFAQGKIKPAQDAITKMEKDLETAKTQLTTLQKAAAAAPKAAAPVTTESLRRKYRLGLISLNEYNIKRRR